MAVTLKLSVERLLRNSSDSCNEISRLHGYGGSIVFADSKAHKVKIYDPLTGTVNTLMGTGQEGTADGTEENCTFKQVHGICSLQNTISVLDIAVVLGYLCSLVLENKACF